jgi:bifunctional N-acetylglucosamine-1-phosphate-uridyltransferase/glucosamine-1-phosphate-acetyltransferase GlmU-like protein
LQKYLQLVQKSGATGEYYLTSLIDLAIKHGEKVETVRGGSLSWRGVNTREDLRDAEKLLQGE